MLKVKYLGIRSLIAVAMLVAFGLLPAACGSSGSDSSSSESSTGDTGNSNGQTNSETASSCPASNTIGMLVVAPVPLFDEYVTGFKEGYSDQTGIPVEEVNIDEQNAQGEPSNFLSMARQFADGSDQIIGAIGTPVTAALQQSTTEKPIVTIAISDPVASGIAKSLDEPGNNVTGSVDAPKAKDFLADVAAIDPEIASVGTIYTTGNDAVTGFNQELEEAEAETGVKVTKVGVANTSEIGSAARSLIGKVDAIVIGRDAEVASALPSVVSLASQSQTPVFLAYTGEGSLIPGVVGGYGSSAPHVGQLAGEVAGKVCEGAEPATTPYAQNEEFTWEFRKDELAKFGLEVPAEIKGRSKVVAGEKASE